MSSFDSESSSTSLVSPNEIEDASLMRTPSYSMPRKPKQQPTEQYYMDKYGLEQDTLNKIDIFLKMYGLSNRNFHLNNMNQLSLFLQDQLPTGQLQPTTTLDNQNLTDLFKSNDTNNDNILTYDQFLSLYKSLISKA